MKYNLSAIQTAAANINANDGILKVHVEGILKAANEIEHSALSVAYHVRCIHDAQGLLEGNTSGYPTNFVDFCKAAFGIERAQAFNLATAGTYVSEITTHDGKKTVLIDNFTYALCKRKSADEIDLSRRVVRAKSFGQTALTEISRYNVDPECIVDLMENGLISPDDTIKQLKATLAKRFKGLPTKDKDNDSKDNDSKDNDSKDNDSKDNDSKDNSSKGNDTTDISIPVVIAKNAYPVLSRYADESPEIASLLHYLSGYAEVVN